MIRTAMSPLQKFLAASLVLNVALAAALLTRSAEEAPAFPDESTRVVTNTVTRTVVGPAEVLTTTNTVALQWDVLESADYVKYIANLRSVGCPEETIRDIVIADINKLFAQRWRETQPPVEPWRYWRLKPRSENKSVANAATRHGMEVERAALIRELLGVDFDAEMGKYAWTVSNRYEDAYGFLPEGKRLLIQDWEGRAKIDMRRLQEELKAAREPKEVRDSLIRELETAQRKELGALLTPAEVKEFQLRHSELADQLRRYTDALEPTEREFRTLFDLLSAAPDGLSQLVRLRGAESPLNDPFLQPRVQEILGAERTSQFFALAFKPDKKEARRLQDEAQRAESNEAAATLKQIAEQEIARIAADASLTDAAKEEQIRLIQKERKRMASELKKGARPKRK